MSTKRIACRIVLKEHPELSIRQVAAEVGCGVRLAHEVKAAMQSEGVVFPGNTIGRDGVSQPAKKPRTLEGTSSTGAQAEGEAPSQPAPVSDTAEISTVPRSIPLDNPRHERFVQEYVIDFNGAQAYVRAGYSPNGARTSASKLLADPNVIARVQYLVDRRAEKLEYEGERVMLETARLAMSDICDVLEVTDADGVIIFPSETWNEHAKRAVESVKQTETFDKNGDRTSRRTELKMHSKSQALTLLSQQVGIIGKAASRAPGGLTGLPRLGIFILPALDPEPDWDDVEGGESGAGYRIALPPLESENGDDPSGSNGSGDAKGMQTGHKSGDSGDETA